MRLNLHLLRIFFTVVEQQSFSRAAKTLFISQPAVSKAVRELERQLELTLIERSVSGAKGICLTENGASLFDHARGLFALERATIDDMQDRISLRQGRLAVGASFTVAGYWLPAYVARFNKQYPDADLRIQVGNTQTIAEALLDCHIDLALVEGTIDHPHIALTHWRDDELCIVVSSRSPLAKKRSLRAGDLNKERWLLREPGSGTREVNERLMQEHHIQPHRMLEFGSNEGISRAVASGAGIAMLPSVVVRELIKVGEIAVLRYPLNAPLRRPLFLAQLRERALSPLARAFCQTVQ